MLDWIPTVSPLSVVLIPFIGAALIALAASRPFLRDLFCWLTPIPFFIAVLGQLPNVLAGAGGTQALVALLPGLEIGFAIKPLGMMFALLASTLWLLATPYALGYLKHAGHSNIGRFMACYAIALGAAAGIAFSENLLTLYIFYEILSISTYPLVAHSGDKTSRDGARTYIALLLVTSVGLMLPAMVWIWQATGTLSFTSGGILGGEMLSPAAGALLLVLLLFGIGKAALMPFHRWLPAAMVAPTPVSALLHAVAVVKAGVFSVLTVVLYIFGLDYIVTLATHPFMLYLAVFTMLAASLVAIQQDNLKARLAYSTVSQLAYIVTGALLAVDLAAIGGGMHMLMHGFGKITLFFCAGAIYLGSGIKTISAMDGLGRRMPVTMIAFFIGALCVIGLPPTGGFWSKLYLVTGAWSAGHYVVVGAFMLSTLLNIGYLLPPVMRAFLKPPADEQKIAKAKEAPLLCLIPLSLTALGTLVLFFAAGAAFNLLSPAIP